LLYLLLLVVRAPGRAFPALSVLVLMTIDNLHLILLLQSPNLKDNNLSFNKVVVSPMWPVVPLWMNLTWLRLAIALGSTMTLLLLLPFQYRSGVCGSQYPKSLSGTFNRYWGNTIARPLAAQRKTLIGTTTGCSGTIGYEDSIYTVKCEANLAKWYNHWRLVVRCWCRSYIYITAQLETLREGYDEHSSKSSLSCETKVYQTSRRKN
jgi:hypothetical protein